MSNLVVIILFSIVVIFGISFYFKRRKLSELDKSILRRGMAITKDLKNLHKIKKKRDNNNREYLNALAKYNVKYNTDSK